MSVKTKRYSSIDQLRGLIMVLMAIDHASFFVASVHFQEPWGVNVDAYPSIAWMLSRLVTHLCAPGFFLLMGMSMILFYESRSNSDWPISRIRSYFIKRGILLFFVLIFLEGPAWALGFVSAEPGVFVSHSMPGTGGGGLPLAVLYALGASMICASFLLQQKAYILLIISLLVSIFSVYYIEQTSAFEPATMLEIFLLRPGNYAHVTSLYPLFPWLGIATFGMALAKMRAKNFFNKMLLVLSLSFLGLFLLLRLNGLGNFQVADYANLIGFFTIIKYPPSLCYLLFTLGMDLLLFYLLLSFPKLENRYLGLFGQTALFFYIAHLYVYMILGQLFPSGCSLAVLYIFWAIGLVVLYFICYWYRGFKAAKPAESFWRFF